MRAILLIALSTLTANSLTVMDINALISRKMLLSKIKKRIIEEKRAKYKIIEALTSAYVAVSNSGYDDAFFPFTKKKFDVLTNFLPLSPQEYELLEKRISSTK